jgi:hypothetical protein
MCVDINSVPFELIGQLSSFELSKPEINTS